MMTQNSHSFNLRPYQQEAIQAINTHWDEWQRELLVLPTGCHGPDQEILMHSGETKYARDIKIGDLLMGPDGFPREVLALHHGHDNMYKVVPVKGDPFIVNSKHILPLVMTNIKRKPRHPSQARGGTVDLVSVEDWFLKSNTWKHIHKLYRSDLIQSFGKEQCDLPLDPYFLGILLGDGGLTQTINITTPDPEVVDEIMYQADKYGLTIRTEPAGKATTFYMKGLILRNKLKSLGLLGKDSGKKEIPFIFKIAPVQARLELLAGLIDADGHRASRNGYDYVSKSKELADGIAFLSRSLGLAAYVSKAVKCIKALNFTGTYYRVSISGETSIIPCRVKRKKSRSRRQKKDVKRTGIKNIEPVGIGEYFGFTVDGDNLYLMGDFTVTHNCGKTVVFNTVASQRPGNTLILAHREELIEQARDKYESMFGEKPGKIKASENDIRRITVGSVQTMCRRDYTNQFDTVIIDEAHHAVSPSYQKLLEQFPDAKVLGVTATPDRGDKRSLAKYFDGIAYEYSLKTAIKDGYLCDIVAKTIPLQIDLSECKISLGDFQVDSVGESLEPYLPQIADAIKLHASARKTVVFCPLISIAQELAGMIPGAREVNGGSQDRKEILKWFDQAGPGAVLCNAMLLTEGWDCPSCDCVVVLRPTKIRSLYAQMIGRGTRLSPGKENLLILDFLWLTSKHNLCKPASLISDNEEDIEQVVKKTCDDEEIDLLGAVSDAEESRRNALAEALRRQAKKKSKLVNPLELFSIIDDIGLADYEPSFQWEEADASQKQVEVLERFGIDADGITKGYACVILDRLINRSKNNLATVKQIRALKRFGYEPAGWTFDQASKKLSALAAVGWKRWKLND